MIDGQHKPLITSRHNPHVKEAARLRDRRHREKQGRILIDGARELRRAAGGGVRLLQVFVCPPLLSGDDTRLPAELAAAGCEVLPVSEDVFHKLAFGQRAEGLLGVAETPRRTLSSLRLAENALVAVLEGVEKPGNLGAVLRSADAAGVSAVLVADGRTDLYNPNAIRASLGTIFSLPLAEATASETREWLAERELLDRRRPGRRRRAVYRRRLPRPDGDRAGERGRRIVAAVARPGRPGGTSAHARRGRQPERLGDGGGAVLRSPAATKRSEHRK